MASELDKAATAGYVLENSRDTCAELFEAIRDLKLLEVRVPTTYDFPLQSVSLGSIT